MILRKKIAITLFICAAFIAGGASAFDQSFHPNHKFVERESIGPNLNPDLVIDKDKAAKVKTAEEEFLLPSGVNPGNPSGANPNSRLGSEYKK